MEERGWLVALFERTMGKGKVRAWKSLKGHLIPRSLSQGNAKV